MSMLFESTVADIFRKFDMLLNRELGYSEFRGFCDCVGRITTDVEFSIILQKFSSTRPQEGTKSQKMFQSHGPSGSSESAA